MIIIADKIEVCSDCTFYLANGRGDWMSDEDVARIERGMAVEAGKGQHWVNACEEGCEGWFSWRPCRCCGSKRGGERHHAAILGPEE